jgi:hypothetical protein
MYIYICICIYKHISEYSVKREKEQSGKLSPKSQDKKNDENLKNTIAMFTSKMVHNEVEFKKTVKNVKSTKDENVNTLQTHSYESDLSNVSEGTYRSFISYYY